MFDANGERKYLNAAERQAFIEVAERQPDRFRRAFCLTLFYTGCRISEALQLKTMRIDLSGKAIIFLTMKQRKHRMFRSVPVPDCLLELLQQILAGRESSARIWNFHRVTGYRLIKDIMGEAGVMGSKACPKGLRHGFGIACVAKGIPLTMIQKWLGHARLETTAIYLNATGDEERELAHRL